MKKLLLAGFAFGALIAPAAAADMPIKAPAYVAPPPSWTGFYVGLNAGWAGSQNSVNSVATPVPDAALGVIPGVSAGLAALSTGSVHAGNRSGFIGGGSTIRPLPLYLLFLPQSCSPPRWSWERTVAKSGPRKARYTLPHLNRSRSLGSAPAVRVLHLAPIARRPDR